MQIEYSTSNYPASKTVEPASKLNRFAFYAWGTVAYNLLVILWGAYVRATGSGAGCGSHWPLCNGEVMPRSPQLETIIELTHRLSSGLALVAVVGLLFFAFRLYPRKHPVRLGAVLSIVFILIEALIGAGLVLLKLVAENASIARAFYLSVHLINTFVLLAVLTLTAWWASGMPAVRLKGQKMLDPIIIIALLGTLILGVSGAITALGDTLFPVSSLQEGLQQDNSAGSHLFVRLRVFHPAIAIIIGSYLIIISARVISFGSEVLTKRIANVLIALVLIQLGIGAINIYLLAPIWMQLAHLLLADLVWMALVLLAAASIDKNRVRTI
jgi:heme A synthase